MAIVALSIAVVVGIGCGDGPTGPRTRPEPKKGPDLGSDGVPTTPTITAGQLEFVNDCPVELSLFQNRASWTTLAPGGGTASLTVANMGTGNPNVFMPYPNLTSAECPNCDEWTALGGVPGTTQREGWMWEGDNARYAAYCNPNLSGRSICATQMNCCGPGMVQDGTFGTTFEFTPRGGSGQNEDFVDLSTNYGSGPHDPPHLCPYPANPNDCVSAAANIFFNVPVQWWSNSDCSCTSSRLQVTSRKCDQVSCEDAYQHPTDDKQCSCSSGSTRGYVVQFCPSGSALPGSHDD